MTNNIVAIFSCSTDSNGNFIEYTVASGSTFTEEYSETLHSAVIVLPHIKSNERLNLKPSIRYEFVKLYDASGNTSFSRTYIVDNFVEKEINIKEHIFSYTINLVSQTKILEKIQCPNIAITHKVNEDGTTTKKTIYQYIKQFMELYIPKFKFTNDGTTWTYEPLIKWYTETSGTLSTISLITTPDDFSQAPGSGLYYATIDTQSFPDDVDLSYDEITITDTVFRHIHSGTLVYDTYNVQLNKAKRCFTITVYVHSFPSYPSGTAVAVSYNAKQYPYAKRFDVPCVDMPMTTPTLRQLLTSLMQQVGCIPTVEDRTLGYLDFQVDATQFGNGDYTVGDTVNFIQRSFSGDSAVNSIVKMNSSVLDSENKVIVETLGFRDRSNAFLKQTQNLQLETSFPIYKIEEVKMRMFCGANVAFQSSGLRSWYVYDDPSSYHEEAIIGYSITSMTIGTDSSGYKYANIVLSEYYNTSANVPAVLGYLAFSGKCFFFKKGSREELGVGNVNATLTINNTAGGSFQTVTIKCYPTSLNTDFDGFVFAGQVSFSGTAGSGIYEKPYTDYGPRMFLMIFPSVTDYNVTFSPKIDITPLIVESSVRSMLETNFIDMKSARTIEELSKYVYGTLEYSIGSKVITGFSQQWSEIAGDYFFGPFNLNKTYIENIFNFILNYQSGDFAISLFDAYYGNAFALVNEYLLSLGYSSSDIYAHMNTSVSLSNLSFNKFKITSTSENQMKIELENMYNEFKEAGEINEDEVLYNNSYNNGIMPYRHISDLLADGAANIFNSDVNFSFLFFDIKYQPLNSFNIAYVKNEDLPYNIEQYDGSADGISDFDRLSLNAQENVERIGNEVLSINQLTTEIGDIQDIPTYFQIDFDHDGILESTKYIIYRKQFSIGNYSISANYTGSKDAILKDYFTSIRTKYRAYQYIDYTSSVLRKRNDTIYVCISENGYFDGDDHVWLGNFDGNFHFNKLDRFISGAAPFQSTFDNDAPILAACERSYYEGSTTNMQMTKNDISVISSKNTMAIIYECLDNVGSGPYISIGQIARGGRWGGVLQSYQIWNEDLYNESHNLFFTTRLRYDESFYAVDFSSWTDYIAASNKILKAPIIDTDIVHINADDDIPFMLVDNKSSGSYQLTFYKDYAERINHTTQFIYYTDSKNIIWTENFIKYNGFILDKSSDEYANLTFLLVDISDEDFALSDSPYDSLPSGAVYDTTYLNAVIDVSYENTNNCPYIHINWNAYSASDNPTALKLVSYNSSTKQYRDVIAFKRDSVDTPRQEFYVSLNDTRSEIVWAEQNGVLYEYGKIKYNTINREIDEEE